MGAPDFAAWTDCSFILDISNHSSFLIQKPASEIELSFFWNYLLDYFKLFLLFHLLSWEYGMDFPCGDTTSVHNNAETLAGEAS